MRFQCTPNWALIFALILGLMVWVLAIEGFRQLVFGAELDGQPLETRIIFDKQAPTIEFWQDMGGYKQKVWDNRPGPMQDASELKLRPFQNSTIFEEKDNAPVRERR